MFLPSQPFIIPPPEAGDGDDDDDDPLTSFDRNAQINRVDRESRNEKSGTGNEKRGAEQKKASGSKNNTLGIIITPNSTDDYSQCYITLEAVAKGVYWTFFDQEGDPRPEEANRAGLHYTKGLDDPDGLFCTISLNVAGIRPLLDASSSPMERILATNMMAISVSYNDSVRTSRLKCSIDDSRYLGRVVMSVYRVVVY